MASPAPPPAAARRIFLTGASSGIGEALALEWASRGAHIALVARREPELARVAALVNARGGRALPIVADVADSEAAVAAVKKADAEMGGLDMVVANAGLGSTGNATRAAWGEVAKLVDVNVRGAMATLTAAIPVMLAQQHGHLVGVTSLAGRRALPGSSAYSATKAALSTFLVGLRLDLAPTGIKVTDVQPGFVHTPMTARLEHAMPLAWTAEKAARFIAGRLERAPAQVAFPWQLDLATSFARILPEWLYKSIVNAAR